MNVLAGRLSKRERDVIMGLAEGMPTAEIAAILRISPKTVNGYRVRVMKKLEARNGLHAVALWVRGEDRTVETSVILAADDLVKAVFDIALSKIHRMPKL